jgi:3-polyprenyl-4-hydroxybenzoate decarboxylase
MKNWMIIVIASVIFVASLGYGLYRHFSTRAIRVYERDNYKLELMTKRQELEMLMIKQRADLSKMQRDARRIKPSYQSEK